LTDLLILIRVFHFASTISVVGATFFALIIAEPALRATNAQHDVAALARCRFSRIIWISLVAAAISGAGWLILLARQLSGLPMEAVLFDGPLWNVLVQTDFGQAWTARFALVVLIAAVLGFYEFRQWPHSCWGDALMGLLAAGLVGTLALAGHAAANMDSDIKGMIHIVADTFHLIAAAAWVGALVPFAVLLRTVSDNQTSIAVARFATSRFSVLGVASVGIIVMTGVFNSWILTGSVHALIATEYGQLLLLKIALFLVMVWVAAINRLRFTPRLLQDLEYASAQNASRQLRRNAIIEAMIGIIILVIVAILGIMSPEIPEMDNNQ